MNSYDDINYLKDTQKKILLKRIITVESAQETKKDIQELLRIQ